MKELPTEYQKIIHLTRYARYVEEEKRRESWEQTVDRYIDYMISKVEKIPEDE